MNDPSSLLHRRVDELELSVRTSMALDKTGIQTVGELVAHSPHQLKASGLTKASIAELSDLLGAMGLNLAT